VLQGALGAQVRVRAGRGGYRAELVFADVEEAQALARRLAAAGGGRDA